MRNGDPDLKSPSGVLRISSILEAVLVALDKELQSVSVACTVTLIINSRSSLKEEVPIYYSYAVSQFSSIIQFE